MDQPSPVMYPGAGSGRGLGDVAGGEGAWVAQAEWLPSWSRLVGAVCGCDLATARFEGSRTKLTVGAAQSGSSRSGWGMEGTGRGSACPAAGSAESGTSVPAAAELAMVSQPCGTHVLQVGDALAGMEGDGCLRRSGNLNSQKRRNSRSVGGSRYYILLIGFV